MGGADTADIACVHSCMCPLLGINTVECIWATRARHHHYRLCMQNYRQHLREGRRFDIHYVMLDFARQAVPTPGRRSTRPLAPAAHIAATPRALAPARASAPLNAPRAFDTPLQRPSSHKFVSKHHFEKRSMLRSFLNLHYPAPAQARSSHHG